MHNIKSYIPNVKKLLHGTTWSALGTIFYRASMLLAIIIIARIIGIENFGRFSFLQSTVTMLTVFACFGLTNTATRYISKYFNHSDKEKSKIILNIIFLSSVLTSILVSLSLALSGKFFINSFTEITIEASSLYIASFLLFFSSTNSVFEGILFGFKEFKFVAISKVVVALFLIPITVFATSNYFLNGGLFSLAFSHAFLWIIFTFKLIQEINISYLRNFNLFKKYSYIFTRFSIPSLFGSSIIAPTKWLSLLFLINFSNEGLDEIAIYNAANQWVIALLFLPNIISKVSLPLLTQIDQKDNNSYINFIKASTIINFSIVFLFSIPIVFASSFLMGIYGESFIQGEKVLIVGAVTACLISINSSLSNVLLSKAKVWLGFRFNLIWSLLMLILSYIFTSIGYGAFGLMLAMLISYIIHTILQLFFITKFIIIKQ